MEKTILFVFLLAVSQNVKAISLNQFSTVNTPATYELLTALPKPSFPDSSAAVGTVSKTRAGPRCGEIMTKPYGDGIFYKPFESVAANERCVWIIAPPKSVGFNVRILYVGNQTNVQGTDQELIVTGFRKGETDNAPSPTSYKPTSTGVLNISSANILVITFLSGNTDGNGNGFALQYDQQHDTGVESQASHHMIETPFREFQYPPNSTEYSNNELAAILFLPKNNIRMNDSFLYTFRGGLQGCRDSLYIFRLMVSAPAGQEKWRYSSRFCESTPLGSFHGDDLILALFQSDETKVNSGFSLSSYVGCSPV